jgi:hypothetical protein
MKNLGLVWVLLFLAIGAFMGPAMAQLTAGQSVPPSVNVGENAMVTVTLTYYGSDATQAIITPGLPPGIETSNPEGQTAQLYPGITAPISYPIRAIQSGNYTIASDVSYSEDGTWRNLRLLSDLMVIGQTMPMQPGQMAPPGFGPQLNGSAQGQNSSQFYPPDGIEMNQSGWMPNSPLPMSPDGYYSADCPEDAPHLNEDQTPDQISERYDEHDKERSR